MAQQRLAKSLEKMKQQITRRVSRPTPARSSQGGLHPILQLQRTVGNRAVGRLMQAKLAVSHPDGAPSGWEKAPLNFLSGAAVGKSPLTQRHVARGNDEQRGADHARMDTLSSSACVQRKAGEGKVDPKQAAYEIENVLWVLDDMMSGYGGRLINEPNVPEKYRPALRKLNHSIWTGKDRTEFDEAVLGLRDVIDHASPAVHTWLAESRSKLFKGEARGRIENSLTVGGKVIEIPDDKHPREQGELLRSQLPRFIETMKIANEQLVRYGHQLDHMLGEHGGHDGALGKLAVMQNLLFLADGWLKLTDEELAHELSHIRGFFPTVSTYSELLLAIVEVGGSSIALTATLASGIAKLAGDAALSASAAEVASSVGHTLGNVVAVVEIVHGIFVLLDSKATGEAKERAAFGIASGVGWFAGGAAGSIAVFGGYLIAKAAAHLYWQGALGLTTGFMRVTFDHMQNKGASIALGTESLARAGMLLHEEKDPMKSAALKAVEEEQAIRLGGLIDSFLDDCKPEGKGHGWGNENVARFPGNYTILAEAFAPLQSLRGRRTGPAVAEAAAKVLEKITWCFQNAADIIVASAKGKHLQDVEESEKEKREHDKHE